jgi:hypothetical protein
MTVIIIPCGFRKRKVTSPACELYQGPYFKSNLEWARSVSPDDLIFILSAKHGLVKLDHKLEPYDLKMGERGSVGPHILRHQISELKLEKAKVYAVGGHEYLSALHRAGVEFCAPVKGFTNGPVNGCFKKEPWTFTKVGL